MKLYFRVGWTWEKSRRDYVLWKKILGSKVVRIRTAMYLIVQQHFVYVSEPVL